MIYDVEINSAAHYPAADVPGLIELAEQVGFGAFWKGESNSTDPIVMLSAVASRTKKIKLGTAIYHIYGRSPVTLGIQSQPCKIFPEEDCFWASASPIRVSPV